MAVSNRKARQGDSAKLHAYLASMLEDDELKRLRWRATHRGTREADMLVGGFFDAHHASWDAGERAKFAEMLEEQDADILAWAHGTGPPPARFEGPMMDALKRLDYIPVAK
jgi:antitoxin CptB